jgi:hypothetical protein
MTKLIKQTKSTKRVLFLATVCAFSLCAASLTLPTHALAQSTAAPEAVAKTAAPGPNDTFMAIDKPAEGTLIALSKPKVSLSLLTAASTREPQPGWNENATKFMMAAIEEHLKAKSYTLSSFDLAANQDPNAVQVTKLYDAVSGTIQTNQWIKLPTKKSFDYSLGKDAMLIVTSQDKTPRYALILEIEGAYSSAGRAALMIGAALLRTSIPTGYQSGKAALIDLSTGQIVWHQVGFVASGTDIRTAEGAKSYTESLFKKLPL